jgi:hypothetical protein
MRKFSYKAPEPQAPVVPAQPQLSLEEQAILQDEQNEVVAKLDEQNDDIDRLVDTDASIQDTVLIVDQTPELGVVEQALVGAVADAAVAGTDAEPEQVISATPEGLASESFVSETLERLKKIWEKIKEYLINAWKSLVEYLAGEKRQIEAVQKEAEKVEAFLEENKAILQLEYVPNHPILLGHDPAVKERADAKKAQDQADYDKRVADEAQAKADSEQRGEEERKAKIEHALAELRNKIASHHFQFKGNVSLISTTSGVPKDFEKEVVNLSSYAQQVHKAIGQTLRELCHAFDDVLGKFDSASPQAAIPGFVDRFHKDFEVLGRAIGEMKNHDGLLRAHTRVPLLGQFDVEITDEKKEGDVKLAATLGAVGRAAMKVSYGTGKKEGDVPLLPELLQPVTTATIKKWAEFQLGHDAVGLENTLKEYGEKFVPKLDRLVQVQQSVKGVADENESYHVIQGLINVCRGLDKMIIEFTLKYGSSVRNIMQSALRYQHEAAQERIRLYKEAVASI